MGHSIKAERRKEHFAVVLGPLFRADDHYSQRRLPTVPAVTFEASEKVAKNVQGNSYATIVQDTVCLGTPKGDVFLPGEWSESERSDKRFVCFHGHYGLYLPKGNGPGIPAAINCGVLSGDGVDCLGDLEDVLKKLMAKLEKELQDKDKFLREMVGGFKAEMDAIADGYAQILDNLQSPGFWGGLWDSVRKMPGKLADAAQGAYQSAKAAAQQAGQIYDALKELSPEQIKEAILDWLLELLNEIACKAKSLLEDLINSKDSLGKMLGGMLGNLTGEVAETAALAAVTAATAGAAGPLAVSIKALRLSSKAGKMAGAMGKFKNPLAHLSKTAERVQKGARQGKDWVKKKLEQVKRKNRDDSNQGHADAGTACPSCPTTDSPVNPVLGCKVFADDRTVDFNLPGTLSFAWQRNYASNNPEIGLLGQGWRLMIELELRVQRNAPMLIDQFGREIRFAELAVGGQTFQPFEQLTLHRDSEVSWRLVTPEGLTALFVGLPDGYRHPLSALFDRNGNRIDILREPLTGLPRELHTATRRYRFDLVPTAQGTRLGAVFELPQDGEPIPWVHYTFDPVHGDLLSATNADGVTPHRYRYKNHLLTAYATAAEVEHQYVYDQYTPKGKVLRYRSSEGQQLDFAYRDDHTVVTNLDGAKTTYHFNAARRWTGTTEPDGAKTDFQLDGFMRPTATVDPLGRKTSQVLDGLGRPILMEDATGAATYIRYHPVFGEPIAVVDAEGNTTEFDYDARGNLAFVRDAAGAVTRYESNAQGLPERIIDPRGGVTQLAWDAEGRPLVHRDCSGQITRYDYDSVGQLAAVTNALGQVTRYQHDRMGRLHRVQYPDGAQEKLSYDLLGRLTEYRDPLGRTTRYHLRSDGQPVERIEPDGSRLGYHYDRLGRLSRLVNQNGAAYRFDYDQASNLIRETGFDGLVTRYTYNRAGELIRRDGASGSVAYVRDAAGRVVEQFSNDDRVRFDYDRLGRITSARNTVSRLVFGYGPRGELTAETLTVAGQSFTITHRYDGFGQRIETTTPQGRKLGVLYSGPGRWHDLLLDGESLCAVERDALHRPIARRQGRLTTTMTYDVAGRLTSQVGVLDGLAVIDRHYQWNGAGELLSRSDSRRGTTHYEYDRLGRLLRAVSPHHDERFAFDPAHNRIDLAASRRYDAERAQAETLPERLIQRHLLNEALNDPDWNPVTHPLPDPATWQAAQTRKRQEETGVLGRYLDNRVKVMGDTVYVYDAAGRVVEKRKPGDVLKLTWDDQDRLIQSERIREQGSQITQYAYDPFGRRVVKQDETETRYFVWSDDVPLQELIPDEAGLTVKTHVFEPESFVPVAQIVERYGPQPVKPVLPREVVAGHQPTPLPVVADPNHRWQKLLLGQQEELKQIDPEPELSPAQSYRLQVFHVHCDHLGTPYDMTDPQGRLVWAADYKAWGEIARLAALEGIEQPFRFQGQYSDQETGFHYNRHRYFSPETGLFVTSDPIGLKGGYNFYQYAPNPNIWIDPIGLAKLFQLGTYGGLNGSDHVGDDLQAHELIRHKFLETQGFAVGDCRMSDNPSIALDLDHHTRGPEKDTRGIGGAHWHEKEIRRDHYQLDKNQFATSIKRELDITAGGLRKAGVPASRVKKLRKQAERFYRDLKKSKKACNTPATPTATP
ncbi:RHS repeat-associated core domain-containing protein [Chitinimonas lacunae]|uniref:RHS repeat-associated core domain-containing protein n=1 Tax=Chitinimonas lacunae TaxID=1963018 RepID=A0ABV8MYS4_9NEIS